MINGLSKYSTEGSRIAINYFMQPAYKGLKRIPPPRLIRGNLDVALSICESSNFKHKYTSGVLSFTIEETEKLDRNPALLGEILDEFERFAFAGVSGDCRQYIAVEHKHTGRLEIHYLIPRIHLATGKYFNPFPPGFTGANDAFIDYLAAKYDLDSPRDPERRRLYSESKFEKEFINKKQIHEAIVDRVSSGLISDAHGVRDFLESIGLQVVRHGNDYMSIKLPDREKTIRLKGAIYGREFSIKCLATSLICSQPAREKDVLELEQRYQELLKKRICFVEERYKGADTSDFEGAKIELQDLQQAIRNLDCAINCDLDQSNPVGISDFLNCYESCLSGSFDLPDKYLANSTYLAIIAIYEVTLRIFGIHSYSSESETATAVNFAKYIVYKIFQGVRSVRMKIDDEDNRPFLGYALLNNNKYTDHGDYNDKQTEPHKASNLAISADFS